MVLSIPSYAEDNERIALLDSAQIAGVECMGLLSDHLAIAKAYSYMRRNDIMNAKDIWKTICFIDFGYSYFSITFVQFGAREG